MTEFLEASLEKSRLGESFNHVPVLKEQLHTKFIENTSIQYLSGSHYEPDTMLTSLHTILILVLTTSL